MCKAAHPRTLLSMKFEILSRLLQLLCIYVFDTTAMTILPHHTSAMPTINKSLEFLLLREPRKLV